MERVLPGGPGYVKVRFGNGDTVSNKYASLLINGSVRHSLPSGATDYLYSGPYSINDTLRIMEDLTTIWVYSVEVCSNTLPAATPTKAPSADMYPVCYILNR